MEMDDNLKNETGLGNNFDVMNFNRVKRMGNEIIDNSEDFFLKKIRDNSSICGATDTPSLDFSWRLHWVSKPGISLTYVLSNPRPCMPQHSSVNHMATPSGQNFKIQNFQYLP